MIVRRLGIGWNAVEAELFSSLVVKRRRYTLNPQKRTKKQNN
jgi:hypothetical protein